MKTTQLAYIFAGLALVQALSLAPSPTESVGCEAHGDHWHCDAPRITSSGVSAVTIAPSFTAVVASSAAHNHEDDHDHDHDHDEEEHNHNTTGTLSQPANATIQSNVTLATSTLTSSTGVASGDGFVSGSDTARPGVGVVIGTLSGWAFVAAMAKLYFRI
ncbi:hypothetical protein B0H66DRAFT_540441 [Apodospora peruviana]|uniref:Uncharacterized protein n=1 Tax=Apodospora peruviana TaxID=516989 RepID=A0AAE0IRG9_9PEZI|nr:hypothetical protein B0H66DRAFT_540441 [Apodospora peruviana]